MLKKKILVVEDHENLLQLHSILLSAQGYEVKGAKDGQEAINAIESSPPDLIILDIGLPGIDGYEVCRHIKSNPQSRHIPVIVVTAKRSKEDLQKIDEVGADWYIPKPFKAAMVIETVQRFLS